MLWLNAKSFDALGRITATRNGFGAIAGGWVGGGTAAAGEPQAFSNSVKSTMMEVM